MVADSLCHIWMQDVVQSNGTSGEECQIAAGLDSQDVRVVPCHEVHDAAESALHDGLRDHMPVSRRIREVLVSPVALRRTRLFNALTGDRDGVPTARGSAGCLSGKSLNSKHGVGVKVLVRIAGLLAGQCDTRSSAGWQTQHRDAPVQLACQCSTMGWVDKRPISALLAGRSAGSCETALWVPLWTLQIMTMMHCRIHTWVTHLHREEGIFLSGSQQPNVLANDVHVRWLHGSHQVRIVRRLASEHLP